MNRSKISFIIPVMKKYSIFLLLAVVLISLVPFGNVKSAAPTAYDLIAAVNELRSANGLAEISTDSSLMAAAQAHAAYLASYYDTNYPSWDQGHIGEGGTYARDRAVTAGYNLTSGMNVVENWAGGNSSTTISEVIYSSWADDTHMSTMLTSDAVAMGAGVSEGAGGSIYFILNVAVKYGSGSSGTGVGSIVPTTAVTAPVVLVQVATSQPDGSIVHVVASGQSLWNIAAAYDVTVDQLKDLNNLSSDIISIGQEIIVQLSSTATPTLEETSTPRAPTRTPVPAQTVQPVSTEAQSTEDNSGGGNILGMNRQTMGLVLILICGAGLALIVIGNIKKDKQPPKSE